MKKKGIIGVVLGLGVAAASAAFMLKKTSGDEYVEVEDDFDFLDEEDVTNDEETIE